MRFSFVIPVYNVAPFLRACLDSLLAQDVQDWEAICVDDGSCDGSEVILDEYANRDSRFRVVHKGNGGVASARNAALDLARGDWVAFLDGDDIVAPWMMRTCLQALERMPDADVVAFKLVTFKDGDKPSWGDRWVGDRCPVSVDSRRHLDVARASTFFTTKVYRRSLLEGVRFERFRVGEDLLFMLEVMLRSDRSAVLENVLYGYRIRQGSAIHSEMSEQKVLDLIAYNARMLEVIGHQDKSVPRAFLRICANRMTEESSFYMLKLSGLGKRNCEKALKEAIARVPPIKEISKFLRFRFLVFGLFPSWRFAAVIFAFPAWLKRIQK